jgi:hypothetical protein
MTAINLKDLLVRKKLDGVARKAKSIAKKSGKSKADAARMQKVAKHEQLRKDVLGLVLTWTDTNPLGSDGCSGFPAVESTNPCLLSRSGVIYSFKADNEYRQWVISNEFEWEIDIELVYALPNNKTNSHRIEPIYFVQRGAMKDSVDELSSINKKIEGLITHSMLLNGLRPDDDKNKGVFEVAKYRVSCVGL